VWGAYIDEAMHVMTGAGASAVRYYPHQNHLYSPVGLTDNTGAVVERYKYDAYGKRTIYDAAGTIIRLASSYGFPVGFTGRYHDKETGLWYFRARYYSGSLGRFVSRDPAQYIDGWQLYKAFMVPNFLDPNGLDKVIIVVVPPPDPAPTPPGTEPEPGSRADTEAAIAEWKAIAEIHNKALDKYIGSVKGLSDAQYEQARSQKKLLNFDGAPFSGGRDQYVQKLEGERLRVVPHYGDSTALVDTATSEVGSGNDTTVFGHSSQVQGGDDSEFNLTPGSVPRGRVEKDVKRAGAKFISCHPENSDALQEIQIRANGRKSSVEGK
jgi:RHS repeat-associated protein